MAVPYYPQITITPNLGLSLIGMDDVIAQDMILIDAAIGSGGGSSVKVNGVTITNPNFNNTTPAAPGGDTNVTFQVDGSGNVSAFVPTSGGGTPGGLNTDVQFNDAGVFGGVSTFTFDKSAEQLLLSDAGSSLFIGTDDPFGGFGDSAQFFVGVPESSLDPAIQGYWGTHASVEVTSLDVGIQLIVDGSRGIQCVTYGSGAVSGSFVAATEDTTSASALVVQTAADGIGATGQLIDVVIETPAFVNGAVPALPIIGLNVKRHDGLTNGGHSIHIEDQGSLAPDYALFSEGGRFFLGKADVTGLQLGGSGSGLVTIQVAAAAGTSNPLVLPTTTGTAGQALVTDGNNPQQLSWATVSGTPSVVAAVNRTGQTASIGTANIVASALAGVYRISYYMKITTAGSTSGSVTLTLVYTDEDDSTVVTYVVPTPANATDSTSVVSGTLIVDAKVSTAITYATTYASVGGTAMVYKLRLKAEKLF